MPELVAREILLEYRVVGIVVCGVAVCQPIEEEV